MSMRFFLALVAFISFAHITYAQPDMADPDTFAHVPPIPASQEEYGVGEVMEIVREELEVYGGVERLVQQVRVRLDDSTNQELLMMHEVTPGQAQHALSVGDRFVVESWQSLSGTQEYVLREYYRLPSLILLVCVFFLIAFAAGGVRGLTSVLGLCVSVVLLAFVVVPLIVAGYHPLLVSVGGSSLIACCSIFLAHGFNRRTIIALASTVVTLLLSIILAVIFVSSARLLGLGTEEAMFLQFGGLDGIDLRGLLLGGIVIGALGVLDDITTAQTAAIDELSKANPSLCYHDLFRAGSSIGREHIASLINTLALAYAGASMPLLLLFSINDTMPLWVLLNSEFLAEEIVRTLVGSASLVLAVPISTSLAAWYFQGGQRSTDGPSHPCAHHTH